MKYEFTGETKEFLGVTLKRIRAVEDIEPYGVKAGDLGGWIEKGSNLSQSGDAWVYGNAQVYGDARVSDNARVSGDARVYGNAQVYGDAWVCSPLYIQGKAYSFSACAKNKIKIGCQIHSFSAWKRSWKRIAKENDFPKENWKEYAIYFNLACDLYGKEKYKIDLKEVDRADDEC